MTIATEEQPRVTTATPIEILRQTERTLRAQLSHLSREGDAQTLAACVNAIACIEGDIYRLNYEASEAQE